MARRRDHWFARASKIADAKGRVGHYPGRVEGGVDDARGLYRARHFGARAGTRKRSADRHAGGRRIRRQGGVVPRRREILHRGHEVHRAARMVHASCGIFRSGEWRRALSRVGQWPAVDEWAADLRLPFAQARLYDVDAADHSGIALRPGDEIRIEGSPDGGEVAALDYLEVVAEKDNLATDKHR